MLNKVVLMGRLVREPELKATGTGTKICTFSVAVQDQFKKEKTHFFNVKSFHKCAEFIQMYFHKGNMIAIDGTLFHEKWEDETGKKVEKIVVVADHVHFCESKKQEPIEIKKELEELEELEEECDLPF